MKIIKENLWWYEKTYNDLINTRKIRGLDKSTLNYYTEKHHIVPKCVGGSNDESNLVLLTPKERIIAHCLLLRLYPDELGIIQSTSAMSEETKKKVIEKLRKVFIQDPEGRVFSTMKECANFYGVSYQTIQFRIKKYPDKWKNIKQTRPISQKVQGPDGTIYSSIRECANKVGVNKATISRWVNKYPQLGYKFVD